MGACTLSLPQILEKQTPKSFCVSLELLLSQGHIFHPARIWDGPSSIDKSRPVAFSGWIHSQRRFRVLPPEQIVQTAAV